MNKKTSSLSVKDLPQLINTYWRRISPYMPIIFLLVVAALYGFVFLRINVLNNAAPTPDMLTAQSNPVKSAHIDKTVVKQLQELQDNSVSVKTLFNDARNNPFQE